MTERCLSRGKRLDNGEEIIGYRCKKLIGGAKGFRMVDAIQVVVSDCELQAFEIDPVTLGRCTGLRDKNGTLIFEGDIVKTKEFGKDDGNGHNWNDYDIFAVCFFEGSFCIENKNRVFIISNKGQKLEIIGNITDNAELLEEAYDREPRKDGE